MDKINNKGLGLRLRRSRSAGFVSSQAVYLPHTCESDSSRLASSSSSSTLEVDSDVKATVRVERLKYSEVPRAVRAGVRAMRADSLTAYVRAGDVSPAVYWIRDHLAGALRHTEAVHQRRALTVGHGDALCTYRLPGDKDSKLFVWLFCAQRAVQPAEMRKRQLEVRAAIVGLMREHLGGRPDAQDMIDVSILATAPERQGRGYGSALMRAVADLGDEQGRAVRVVTTDAYGFYEAVGFTLLGERVVGDRNALWTGEPAHIRLMLREPKRKDST